MLTDIALSHYTTKILRCLKENHLATIVSITKGARIVVSKEQICATEKPRKAVCKNESRCDTLCGLYNGLPEIVLSGTVDGRVKKHLLSVADKLGAFQRHKRVSKRKRWGEVKLEIGTKIKGNINNAEMVIVGFQNADVILKDLKTNKTFSYGLEALKRCNITILE